MLFEIISAVLIIVIFLLIYLTYSGLFYGIKVKVTSSPIPSGIYFYKFYEQDYKKSGEAFRELEKLPIQNKVCLGIYYDKPGEREPDKLRSAIGVFLPADLDTDYEELRATMLDVGFSTVNLPEVRKVILVEFPWKTIFSILIGIYRVYPKITEYVTNNKLHAGPCLEYYVKPKINFILPLEENEKFFVKEYKKTEQK